MVKWHCKWKLVKESVTNSYNTHAVVLSICADLGSCPDLGYIVRRVSRTTTKMKILPKNICLRCLDVAGVLDPPCPLGVFHVNETLLKMHILLGCFDKFYHIVPFVICKVVSNNFFKLENNCEISFHLIICLLKLFLIASSGITSNRWSVYLENTLNIFLIAAPSLRHQLHNFLYIY